MPLDVLADAELVAVAYLRQQSDVAALVGARVSTELPANPTYPLLKVTRIMGVPAVPRRLDAAYLQVEAYADTKAQARLLAATAHAALWAATGAHAGAVITGASDALGLGWVPDPAFTPPKPRYLFAVTLYAHPAS